MNYEPLVLLWSGIQTDLWIHKIFWPMTASLRKHRLWVREKLQVLFLNQSHHFGLQLLSIKSRFHWDQAAEEQTCKAQHSQGPKGMIANVPNIPVMTILASSYLSQPVHVKIQNKDDRKKKTHRQYCGHQNEQNLKPQCGENVQDCQVRLPRVLPSSPACLFSCASCKCLQGCVIKLQKRSDPCLKWYKGEKKRSYFSVGSTFQPWLTGSPLIQPNRKDNGKNRNEQDD